MADPDDVDVDARRRAISPALPRFTKARSWQSVKVLSSLFSAVELTFESERALEVALQLYRKGSADFADCLHIALVGQAGEQPLWTFDKGASKVDGAQLIEGIVPTSALEVEDRLESAGGMVQTALLITQPATRFGNWELG